MKSKSISKKNPHSPTVNEEFTETPDEMVTKLLPKDLLFRLLKRWNSVHKAHVR